MAGESPADTRPARGKPANRWPPGPKGLPLLGNLIPVARDPLGFLARCAEQHDEIIGLRLGPRRLVLVNSPAGAEQVLLTNHRNFIKNRYFWRHLDAIFGQGLLTSEGAFWQRQHRLSAPAFTPQRVESYGEAMVGHTEHMLAGWQTGERRDLHEEMMTLTLVIATETFFRVRLASDTADMGRALEALAVEIAARRHRPFLIPDWVPLPGHRRYRRGLRVLEQIVNRIIAERKQGADGGDLLSALLRARDEAGQPMTDRQLRDEVMTLLLAGHETTAAALTWTFYLLGLDPAADARMAAELREVLGGRAPTVADLPRLRFTERVALEAMRLYPPVWLISRQAIADCEIGGWRIPAGTAISISPWLMHRDPRHFDEPNAFRPERWEDGLEERLPRFAYMPFSGGPRVCIGGRFAMQELMLILATIAQRFRLELRGDAPVEPLPTLTLRPRGAVWIEAVARAALDSGPHRP